MFVYTLKATTLKYIGVMAMCIVAVVMTVALVPADSSPNIKEIQTSAQPADFKNVKSKEDRVRFLESYGWEVDSNSESTAEVTVPEEFDSVYSAYNDIQLSQGLNLEKYKGKEVKCYTYNITNYENAVATLMIYKNKVIGGDVSSAQTDGFTHGFQK